MRPPSIVLFERLYLLGWLFWLAGSIASYEGTRRIMEASLSANGGDASIPGIALIGTYVIAGIVPLILWYFVARRASIIAKWIVVALVLFYLLGVAGSFIAGNFDFGLARALGLASLAFRTVAVVMLFRPDSNEWFGEYAEADAGAD